MPRDSLRIAIRACQRSRAFPSMLREQPARYPRLVRLAGTGDGFDSGLGRVLRDVANHIPALAGRSDASPIVCLANGDLAGLPGTIRIRRRRTARTDPAGRELAMQVLTLARWPIRLSRPYVYALKVVVPGKLGELVQDVMP